MASSPEVHRSRLHLQLMLLLTFSTGVADAVGFLGLDRTFTGNMTGNVVVLGMAIVARDDLPVIGPIVALGCFMIGAVIAGRVLSASRPGWNPRVTWLLGILAACLWALTVITALAPIEAGRPSGIALVGSIALLMGLQAGCARWVGVKDVTTVVVTSTLTGLAADSRLAGGEGKLWARRAGAIVLIGLGALVGAVLLLTIGLPAGIALSAAVTTGVAIAGLWDPAPVD